MFSPTEPLHRSWPALGVWGFFPLIFSPICFQPPQVAFRLDFEFSKSIFLQSMEIYLIANRLMVAFSLARVCKVNGTLAACVGFPSSIAVGDAGGSTRGITARKTDCHGLLQSCAALCSQTRLFLFIYIFISIILWKLCSHCQAPP